MRRDMLSLDAIARKLRVSVDKTQLQPPSGQQAAVAVILADGDVASLLLIERAQHAGDPWSGHLALPGGMCSADDPSPRAAAARETEEEVALQLERDGRYLGWLATRAMPRRALSVSAHVWGVPSPMPCQVAVEEVAAAFWTPLDVMLQTERHTTYELPGEPQPFPALQLLEPGRPLLWGLTYRLLAELFARLGERLP